MGQYSKKSCYKCGILRPINHMDAKTISVKSGKSGIGISFNPQRSKSIRISSGRNYYSNRKVYQCNAWGACNNPDYYKNLEEKKQIEEQKAKEELEKNIALQQIEKENLQNIINTFSTILNSKEFNNLIIHSDNLSRAFKEFFQWCDATKFEKDEILQEYFFNHDELKHRKGLVLLTNLYIKNYMSIDAGGQNSNFFSKSKMIKGVPEVLLKFLSFKKFFLLKKKRLIITILIFFLTLGIGWIFAVIYFLIFKKKELSVYSSFISRFIICEKLLIKELNQRAQEFLVIEISKKKNYITDKNFNLINKKYFDSKLDKNIFINEESNKDYQKIPSDINSEKELISNLYENENFLDISLYILSVYVAKSDGISSEETKYFKEQFGKILSNDQLMLGLNIEKKFGEKKTEKIILKLLKSSYKNDKEQLEKIFNNILAVAELDGEITKKELEKINYYGKSLGISMSQINKILKKNVKFKEDDNEKKLPIIEDIYDEIAEDILD